MSVTPLPPLLPPVTEPPTARTRVHAPARHPYESFRACLRQDFEFTCALCLLHESDLAPLGVEGTGLFTVEHIEPQSTRPDLAEVYRNCLYACRFCNTRRGDLPVRRADGARLLDPTRDGWSDAFEVLQVTPLGADGAVVLGRWRLTETPSPGSGVFSLVLERRGSVWRIVHDHTSSDPTPVAPP